MVATSRLGQENCRDACPRSANQVVGLSGFSASNLWRMRAFYLAYAQAEVLTPLVRELGWSLNVAILEKTQSAPERLFYVTQAHQHRWTKATLLHQLQAQAYQKTVMAQHCMLPPIGSQL